MKVFLLRRIRVSILALALLVLGAAVTDLSGQTNRRRRTSTPPVATATPPVTEPQIISRADEFPDENSRAIPPDPSELKSNGADTANVQALEELGRRIKNLEAERVSKPDPDEKQKRLLLNLDILTRAEQRSESLRKQLFEMIEKENAVKTKMDSLEYDLRPEVIERSTNLIGSLRPEEIRASRRKSLESERNNLQTLLSEIQRNKLALELNLQKADALVEKIRVKLEKEIDTALEDEPENKPEN